MDRTTFPSTPERAPFFTRHDDGRVTVDDLPKVIDVQRQMLEEDLIRADDCPGLVKLEGEDFWIGTSNAAAMYHIAGPVPGAPDIVRATRKWMRVVAANDPRRRKEEEHRGRVEHADCTDSRAIRA